MRKQPMLLKVDIKEGNSEVSAIALVDQPAIEENFMAFSKVDKPFLFTKINQEKKEVLGPAMVPDKAIIRYNEQTKEYFYTTFDADKIRLASQLFLKNQSSYSTNLDHNSKTPAEAYVTQSYIIDHEKGINAPKGMEHLPDGTWMVGMKIESDQLWEDIQRGSFKGFSIEGYLDWDVEEDAKKNQVIEELLDAQEEDLKMSEYFRAIESEIKALMLYKRKEIKTKKEIIMNKKEIFAKFNSLRKKVKFNIVELAPSEVEIVSREVGSEVFLNTPEGRVKIEDGTYDVEGFEFVAKNGLIESIGVEMEGIEEEAIIAVEEEIETVDNRVDELENKIDSVIEMVEEGFKSIFSMLKGVEGPKEKAKETSNKFAQTKGIFKK